MKKYSYIYIYMCVMLNRYIVTHIYIYMHVAHIHVYNCPSNVFVGSPGITPASPALKQVFLWKCSGSDAKVRFAFCNALESRQRFQRCSESWGSLNKNTSWWFSQGTRTGVSLMYVYPLYLLCSTLGFLGIIAHKYPRAIGLINRDFPWRGPTLGSGAHILAELPWVSTHPEKCAQVKLDHETPGKKGENNLNIWKHQPEQKMIVIQMLEVPPPKLGIIIYRNNLGSKPQPTGFFVTCVVGNPNLNLHLPLESWVGVRSLPHMFIDTALGSVVWFVVQKHL